MIRTGTGVVLLAALLLTAASDRAEALDRVTLKDGRVLEGKILTIRFLQVFVETPGGNEVIPMKLVERIERNVGGDAPPEPGRPPSPRLRRTAPFEAPKERRRARRPPEGAIPSASIPPGEKALHDRLAEAIRRQDAAAQAAVMRQLAGAKAKKSVQVLALVVTSDMDVSVRTAAARAMKETPDPEGLFVEPLCRALLDRGKKGKDLAFGEACARALEASEYREMAIDALVGVIAGVGRDRPRAREFAAACREVLEKIAGQEFGWGDAAIAKWRKWWKANRDRVKERDARRRAALTGALAPVPAPAQKRREPTAQETAAADAACLKLRRAVIRGVTDGRRLPLTVKLRGRTVRGWIVEADERNVVLMNFGTGAKVNVPWRHIPPKTFLHLARQYTGDQELLGAYARGHVLGPD